MLDQLSDLSLVLRDLAAIGLLDQGGYAFVTIYLISGTLQVHAKFIHPAQGIGVGNVIGLNDEIYRIRASKDVAHMSEVDERRQVLRHIILEVGIHLDLSICIDAR